MEKLNVFVGLVESELAKARSKHAPINSLHEGYAVILEELDELKAEVWKKSAERDPRKISAELVQLAAMCQRMHEDVVNALIQKAPLTDLQMGFTKIGRTTFPVTSYEVLLKHPENGVECREIVSASTAGEAIEKARLRPADRTAELGRVRPLVGDEWQCIAAAPLEER